MPKILYVEDNEDNVYMLSRRLTQQGFEVVVARDGEEGVAMAAAEAPDLVLMDLGLPVLDGWEATRRLKSDASTRHIPVIALTGHALSGYSKSAKEAGCDAFLTKPCLPDKLVSEIRKMLAGRETA